MYRLLAIFWVHLHQLVFAQSFCPTQFQKRTSGTDFSIDLTVTESAVSKNFLKTHKTLTQPTAWHHPFFIHHWITNVRGAAAFILALEHKYHYVVVCVITILIQP